MNLCMSLKDRMSVNDYYYSFDSNCVQNIANNVLLLFPDCKIPKPKKICLLVLSPGHYDIRKFHLNVS